MDFSEFLENTPHWRLNWLFRQKREIYHEIYVWKASNFIREKSIMERLNIMSKSVRKQREIRQDEKPKTGAASLTTRWHSVDVRNQTDQEAIVEFAKDVDFILDQFVVLVDSGYDISFKRDSRGKPVAYGFLPVSDGAKTRGAISANGQDAYSALAVLMYKLCVKLADKDFPDASDDQWEYS